MIPKKQLRVLQFGRLDYTEITGGVQFYAETVCQHADPEIVIDQIVSAKGNKTKIKHNNHRLKVAVATYAFWQSLPISPTMFYWAWKMVLTRQYDVLHVNFPDPLALLVISTLPKRIPMVVTWHADVIRQKWALSLYMPILKLFMRKVRKIIVATPLHLPSCPQLQALKMNDRVEVIEFGIDPKLYQKTEEVRLAADMIKSKHANEFLLFSFGRHVYYKGYEFLVEAMAKTKNCHLILGGSGPLTETYREIVKKLGIESKVTFIGQVPDSQVASFLYACDAFAFASVDQTEAFGYSQLEAMMCGKPVIAGDLKNGVNYVTIDQQTGLSVPPRDVQKLADAIQRMQTDVALTKRLGQAAKDRAMSLFTVQRTAQRTIELLKKEAQQRA